MDSVETLKKNWTRVVRKYMKPSNAKSNWQLASAVIPYLATWVVAYVLYSYSPLLALIAIVPGATFLLRMFIIMHDCGHGCFFKSKEKNDFWGFVTGVATFSPYRQWTRTHKYHHKHSGNLDFRGIGDIDILTVEEYEELGTWKKIKYKLIRSPLVFLFIGSFYVFVLEHRFVKKEDNAEERRGVHLTNLAMLVIAVGVSYFCGLGFYLLFQVGSVALAATSGIFLFYVQHQFENVYWCKDEEWNHVEASLRGCSYFKLPRVLQWVTGNIGYHHIHHLCSSIPNYNLEKAYKENPLLQTCTVLGFKDSFKALFLNLYDMKEQRLISFREYRRRYKMIQS